jgi:hypothetical protein
LRRFRVYAAERNQSMTSLMADATRKMVDEDAAAEKVKQRFRNRMRNAKDWGTGGIIPWKREDLYDR